MKYDGESRGRIGILIFQSIKSEKPELYILGAMNCSGVKRKWRKQRKIKNWLLYNPHSYSYATRYLKRTIFNEGFEVMMIGEKEKLGLFDKDIIIKKFPNLTKDWKSREGF